jgi:phospholipid transport system substrate-binding protein
MGLAASVGLAGWANAVDISPAQGAAPSQAVSPDFLLNAATLDVVAIIEQDRDFQAGRPMKAAPLIETRILPLFDFVRMTRMAVARNWRLASPAQQTALTSEFKTLLVRSYSTALSAYRDPVIEFQPLRTALDATEVTVRSNVKQAGRERMAIDYDMEKTPAGWKVYDIKVGGVSLVTTYREAFFEQVRDGGVDGLIRSLSDQNRPRDPSPQSFKDRSFERLRLTWVLLQGVWRGGE